jgi:putative OPT family oligopeptide transporter
MASANVYLGLKIGMTVSASIPSAVLSMLILRRLRNSSVGENNLVQTAASAGESLAAGYIFTLPALLLLGIWDVPAYWPSVFICLFGGFAGVLFSAPLRDLLIAKEGLKFPEGVATADIIRKGHTGADGSRAIIIGALVAILLKIGEGIFKFWRESIETVLGFTTAGSYNVAFYVGSYTSPALLAVGFIIGLPACAAIFFGALLSWGFLLPLRSFTHGDVPSVSIESLYSIWSSEIRYVGVGAMLIGAVWTVFSLRSSIAEVFSLLFSQTRLGETSIERGGRRSSERGVSQIYGSGSTFILAVALFISSWVLFYLLFKSLWISSLAVLLSGVFVFLFSIVSGYMAGVVGSSNNPVSGITICAVLLAALVFHLCVGDSQSAMYVVVCLGAFVCCAAAIAGDNLQDLKAGYILGTNPLEQKTMQFVGVFASAFVLPLVLELLVFESTLGSPQLPAPQATLVAGIVGASQDMQLPWGMVLCGVWIAVICILIDNALREKFDTFRLPVLACAVGLYLPLSLSTGIFLGGLCSEIRRKLSGDSSMEFGGLLAAGLVTGEALCGILIACLLSSGIEAYSFGNFALLGLLPIALCGTLLVFLKSS